MPSKHDQSKSKSATPADVVFWFTPDGLFDPLMTIWTDRDQPSLDSFLEDMNALGFAVWETPTAVFVFVGRVDQ